MSNSLTQAFRGLKMSRAEGMSDHEKIYKVSYQYLSQVKEFNDLKSFHNCLVALINMDSYFMGLELLKQVPEDVHREFVLEKAYIYYKTGKTDELLKIYHQQDFGANPVLTRAIKHIVAQELYRNGENDRALELYHDLISTNDLIDNDLDLSCNERAVIHQQKFMNYYSDTAIPSSSIEESYDLLLNDALIHLSKKEYATSLVLLEKAGQKCEEQNSHELSKQDMLIELAPIKLTIAYIYQITGRKQEAMEMLKEFDPSSISDLAIKVTLLNNYYSLQDNEDLNPNLIQRDLNLQQTLHHLQQKLTKPQYQVLVKNHLLLSFYSNTLSSTSSYLHQNFTKDWISTFPGDYSILAYKVLTSLGIKAENINNSFHHKQVARKLYKFGSTTQDFDLASAASIILLFINAKQNDYSQSVSLLKKLVRQLFSYEKLVPALVGALMGLYLKSKRPHCLRNLVKKLVEHVEHTNPEIFTNDPNYYNFIKACSIQIADTFTEYPARLFAVLKTVNPNDKLVRACLGETFTDAPVSVADLTSSVAPIEELLSTNLEQLAPTKKHIKIVSTVATNNKIKKKKVRPPKFSSNAEAKLLALLDPAILDQERWIPLKQRSYYKPTKKSKKKGGSHQGTIEANDAAISQPSVSVSQSTKNKLKKKKKGKK